MIWTTIEFIFKYSFDLYGKNSHKEYGYGQMVLTVPNIFHSIQITYFHLPNGIHCKPAE